MGLISSNKNTIPLIKIFWITVSWTLVALFKLFLGYSAVTDTRFNCELAGLDIMLFLKSTLVTGVTAGLIGGSVIEFLWEKWLRNKSYTMALISILWSYSLVYFIVSLISNIFFFNSQFSQPVTDPKLWHFVMADLLDIHNLESFLFWLIVVIFTLVILQVNDKYGPGVFASFLLGRYFHPKKEERIFMFLDLRSSTSIAEKLGEGRYFSFLKDVFLHATPGILNSKGEIYQYVGDEIVISWKTHKGTENANCIRCFFDIQNSLNEKSDYFNESYGVVPEFKAGLHYGYVMAGEIGVVKREIAFFLWRQDFPAWPSNTVKSQFGFRRTGVLTHSSNLCRDESPDTTIKLHLSVSMRSFRAENVSHLVKSILEQDEKSVRGYLRSIAHKYPIVITRDLNKAKNWLKDMARGSERYGIVVSSQAQRLKPHAIDVKSPVNPVHRFLNNKSDIRSSYYLEDVATEFDVQGLELDWSCVTWDGDFRYDREDWKTFEFRGSKWQQILKRERKQYLKNAYRVLLTRARQGMVIVVPNGVNDDPTRRPEYYDSTYDYLERIGFDTI